MPSSIKSAIASGIPEAPAFEVWRNVVFALNEVVKAGPVSHSFLYEVYSPAEYSVFREREISLEEGLHCIFEGFVILEALMIILKIAVLHNNKY